MTLRELKTPVEPLFQDPVFSGPGVWVLVFGISDFSVLDFGVLVFGVLVYGVLVFGYLISGTGSLFILEYAIKLNLIVSITANIPKQKVFLKSYQRTTAIGDNVLKRAY